MKNLNYTIHQTNNILNDIKLDFKSNIYGYTESSLKVSISNLDMSRLTKYNTKYKLIFKLVNRYYKTRFAHQISDSHINKNRFLNTLNKSNKKLNRESESILIESSFFNKLTNNITQYIDYSSFTKGDELQSFSLNNKVLYLNVYLVDEEKSIVSHKSNIEINLSSLSYDVGDPFINYIRNENNIILDDLINLRNGLELINLEENIFSFIKSSNTSLVNSEDVYVPNLNVNSLDNRDIDSYTTASKRIIDFYNHFDVSIIILDRKLTSSLFIDTSHESFICKIKISDLMSGRTYFNKIDDNFNLENLSNINLNFLKYYINNSSIININEEGKNFFAYITYSTNILHGSTYFENKIIRSSTNSANSCSVLFVNNSNIYKFIFELLSKSGFIKSSIIDLLRIDVDNNSTSQEWLECEIKLNKNVEFENLEFYNRFYFLDGIRNFYKFYRKISENDSLKKYIPKFFIKTMDTNSIKIYNSLNNILYDSDISLVSREEEINLFKFIVDILENKTSNIVKVYNLNESSITLSLVLMFLDSFLRIESSNITLNSNLYTVESNISSKFSFISALNKKEASTSITKNNSSIYFNINLGRKSFYKYKDKFDYNNESIFDFVKTFIILVKGNITVRSSDNRLLSKYKFYNVVNLEDYLQEVNTWEAFRNVRIDLLEDNFVRYNPYYVNNGNITNNFRRHLNENNLITLNNMEYSICVLNKLSYTSLYNDSDINKNLKKIINEFSRLARGKDQSVSESYIENSISKIYTDLDIENSESRIFIYNTFNKCITLTNIISKIN